MTEECPGVRRNQWTREHFQEEGELDNRKVPMLKEEWEVV